MYFIYGGAITNKSGGKINFILCIGGAVTRNIILIIINLFMETEKYKIKKMPH